LNNRILIHNLGKGPDYTRRRRPVKLVYYEKLESKSKARKREIEIKGWRREKKENLVRFGHSLRGE
jgi:putative endonuclease